MKKVFKIAAWVIGIIAVICIAIMLLCNQLVVSNAKGKTFSEIDNIAPAEVGLVLGTTPQCQKGLILLKICGIGFSP